MKKVSKNTVRTRNYFYFKLGFSNMDIDRVFELYCHGRNVDECCNEIQKDWDTFMKWWGTVKDNFKNSYFQNKHHKQKAKRSEWSDIAEALKYTNGCADDF